MVQIKLFFIVLGVSLFIQCSNKYQTFEEPTRNKIEVTGNNLSLADYLRRVPGLYVSGSGSNTVVSLREQATISGSGAPLYVIDGMKVGNNYARVERMIDINDIKSVRVLTNASETSIYGLEGSAGVILIKTKG